MAQDRKQAVRAMDVGVAKRPVEAGKGVINLRIEAQTRQLIDDAATVLGKTRTEFMIDSARRQAIDVLLDQRLFVLDPEGYAAFVNVLDDPPKLSAPVPLTAEHALAEFDCGEPALNDWLKDRALKDDGRFSRTYVVCDSDRVAAYVAISAGAVERAAVPGKLRRNAPDPIPVSVIGRLAVDRAYAGRGLGSDLLADALRRIALASRSIGIAAVLVHAKIEEARRFYLSRAEFIEYPADSRTLFLPIETVVEAIN